MNAQVFGINVFNLLSLAIFLLLIVFVVIDLIGETHQEKNLKDQNPVDPMTSELPT